MPTQIPPRKGVVAVIRQDALFLVIRRAETVSAPGAYCFPGGGIEPGESESAAVVRELQEEIGARSPRPRRCLWRSQTPRGVRLAWWLTELPEDDQLVPNPLEVAAIHWWSMHEMLACGDLLVSNRHFLDHVQRHPL